MKKSTTEQAERRWDVFIYNIETREIVSEAGENLPETGSFHTVEKRIETVIGRINDAYSVDAVPTGKFKKGDILPKDVETY